MSTVAGLVFSLLGRIPAAGDRASFGPASRWRSPAMDGRRLERVLIRKGGQDAGFAFDGFLQ